ncbi:aminomethyl-transferring glycine dehydrogenase subunit GcvPA [Proteiniclasticum sp. QWL-01]|uniref:aminomethyl-transferring glycine dehydrogenase subunit GcvPA n=1 Tax=Proteiniclasticum sp. QWL-01 TaxID=3036945 RepID=UPI0024104B11|nr:aminomethyl-transferring glycine dehydrogenase subunit GcvPA [Proteiniclasticum sp. QWL-01]WFF71954.1 aminomethyl-transferring glycine dehydrogenase subunit GcvPA [Proteiniclasticum sp. QWL-01]
MKHPYLPGTDKDLEIMLDRIGVSSVDALFKAVPANVKLQEDLKLDPAMTEIDVRRKVGAMANKNKSIDDLTCFLGAGSYDHYIPSTVKHIISRSEFYTAYTPYQPEIAQGTLQGVWEYQSMMCMLTGMDVSNVSMYDGPTAAAEAAMLATGSQRRNKILVSEGVNPETRQVLESYLRSRDVEIAYVPLTEDGQTDTAKLADLLDKEIAGLVVGYPNFYGIVEDFSEIVEKVHANKSLFIMQIDPLAMGLLKTPGEIGADIVVGEGQSLGQNLNYGGPVLGFMNITEKLVRKAPGRIIGRSIDVDGNPAYVLTLQAREQHIRREKATSNICSDQTLNSIAAAVYLASMGPEGMKEAAIQSAQKAHYLAKKLEATGKFKMKFNAPYFKEFVMETDLDAGKMNEELLKQGMLGPLSLDSCGLPGAVLFCVTENRSKEEMDKLVAALEVI